MQAYRIVQTINGTHVVTEPKDIVAWAEAIGRAVYWPRRSLKLRPCLQLEPSIDGFCGPMYDGVNQDGVEVVRYEDQQTYNLLSI